MTNMLNIYYKFFFFVFIALFLKVFINKIEIYVFKKVIDIADNRINFNNNLKN